MNDQSGDGQDDSTREPSAAAPTDPAELPIEAEAYLTHLVVERGRSVRTISAYRGDLRRYCGYLNTVGCSLMEANPTHLQAFVTQLQASGLADSSTTRILVSVRGLYRYLSAEGMLTVDPALEIEMPRRADALPKALSEKDIAALLDAAAQLAATGDAVALRDLALLEFLYGTGARVSEACGLGFGDLDLDAALARVLGKRDKERILPLGRPAVHALQNYLDEGRGRILAAASGPDGARRGGRDDMDAVFLGVRGRRLSRQGAWEVIGRWARVAEVRGPISPHVLRHSCATHLLDHGADIRTVAELLGHASVSTTQIYTRVATDRLFEAYRAAHPRAQRVVPVEHGAAGELSG